MLLMLRRTAGFELCFDKLRRIRGTDALQVSLEPIKRRCDVERLHVNSEVAGRPYLLSITAATLTGTHLHYRNTGRTAMAVAIALGLSVTPEVVQLYNENKFSQWASQLFSGKVSALCVNCR